MAGLIFKLFTSSSLLMLGLYHLICSTCNFMKIPHSYTAKPYHTFPRLFPSSSSSSSSANNNQHRFKHIPLYAVFFCLLIVFFHQILISFYSDPLVKGSTPVHRFYSLQSAAVIFLFLLVAVSLPFAPSDLSFALSSAAFFLQFSADSAAASVQTSVLQTECDTVSARISVLCSILCFLLACRPRIFVADAALAAAVCLQGLWQLQMGLSLFVEAFIPDGCHLQLDVASGVEGSTKCDLEETRLRAVAILDLMFVIHVVFVVVIVFVTYAIVAKTVGMRRLGTYEPLSTNSADSNHIQMKALTGTQA